MIVRRGGATLKSVHAAWKGTLLGIANVFVIAIGMSLLEHEPQLMSLVVMFGAVPGLVAGAILGSLAGAIGTRPPVFRVALLALPAICVVFGLATEFAMQDLAMISCIPTLVAVLMLERWTRVAPPEPVPVARVTS